MCNKKDETIEIKKSNAIDAYNDADEKGKKLLSKLLGRQHFGKITDRLKTWEDLCEIRGIHPYQSLPYSDPQNDDQKAVNAFFKINLIREELNEGWVPDWNNTSEYKYYPWFKHSGGGFSCGGYGYDDADSSFGARLCYKSRELAEYAGNQFIEIYKDFHTL